MEWLYNKYDIGGGPEVDKIVKDEYGYLLRFSGLYVYLRNNLWIISFTQLTLYVTSCSYMCYLLVKTAIYAASEDLNMAVQSIHFAILSLLSILMIYACNRHRNDFVEGQLIIGKTKYYKYDDGLEIEELETWKKDREKIKYRLLSLLPVYLGVVVFTVLISPVVEKLFDFKRNEIDGVDMRLPIPLWHPFSKEGPISFSAMLLLSSFATIVVAMAISSIDIIFIFTFSSIILQHKILNRSVERLQERAEAIHHKWYPNKEVTEDKLKFCYMHCIKQNIEHQLAIERVFDIINDAAFLPLGAAVLLGSFILAASLLAFILGESSPAVVVLSALLLFLELANMIMVCYFGQQITDHSYDFGYSLYSTNWATMPKVVRLSITIMMEKAKRPLEPKAGGLWPLNYELFTSIINTAYSYFNILLGARGKIRVNRRVGNAAKRRH